VEFLSEAGRLSAAERNHHRWRCRYHGWWRGGFFLVESAAGDSDDFSGASGRTEDVEEDGRCTGSADCFDDDAFAGAVEGLLCCPGKNREMNAKSFWAMNLSR
jgi:hypothetical protein